MRLAAHRNFGWVQEKNATEADETLKKEGRGVNGDQHTAYYPTNAEEPVSATHDNEVLAAILRAVNCYAPAKTGFNLQAEVPRRTST